MIRPTVINGEVTLEATVNGIAVYLDNWAIIALAKNSGSLRQRFVDVINGGADLLFSIANIGEILGPQGVSSATVKSFLNDLGPHWYPVELGPYEFIKREEAGFPPSKVCLSPELLKALFKDQIADYGPNSGKIVNLSQGFFQLGAFIDSLVPKRDEHQEKIRIFEQQLMDGVNGLRERYKKGSPLTLAYLPEPKFDPRKPATFAKDCLMRELILDRGYTLKKGDGMDFCHAVIAASFADFATLDKHWKRRVEDFPKPNGVRQIYYEPELPQMVTDLEAQLKLLKDRK